MMLTWHVFKHTSLYSKYAVKLCVTFTTKKKNTTELAVLICSFFLVSNLLTVNLQLLVCIIFPFCAVNTKLYQARDCNVYNWISAYTFGETVRYFDIFAKI